MKAYAFSFIKIITRSLSIRRSVFLYAAFFLLSSSLYAQQDTVKEKVHSPKKAAIMSAVIPGLGQIYNRKYWKPPIIYAGAAAIYYFAHFNTKYYKEFRDAYIARVDDDSTTIDPYPAYQSDDLLTIKN